MFVSLVFFFSSVSPSSCVPSLFLSSPLSVFSSLFNSLFTFLTLTDHSFIVIAYSAACSSSLRQPTTLDALAAASKPGTFHLPVLSSDLHTDQENNHPLKQRGRRPPHCPPTMQRVSSLLPSWDRAKTADGASNSGNTSNTGGTAASSSTATTSSTAPNSISYSFNNNRSSTSSSISNANNNNNNRNSSNSTQMRNGRSFAKVFSWADRIGGHKTLSVSPSIANAAATPSPSGQMGREAYWPTALDRECEKAARILKSFCSMFSGVALFLTINSSPSSFFLVSPFSFPA